MKQTEAQKEYRNNITEIFKLSNVIEIESSKGNDVKLEIEYLKHLVAKL